MIPSLSCYLLDEPVAGVKPVIKDQLMELIEAENRSRGLTFVIVSHEMAVMRRLCGRITVLIAGRPRGEKLARRDRGARGCRRGLSEKSFA